METRYTTLRRSPVSGSGQVEVTKRKENPSEPDLTKVSSEATPTLHVAKTPTTAVINGRSVNWEGRTGWKDRYFDTSRDIARVLPGENGSVVNMQIGNNIQILVLPYLTSKQTFVTLKFYEPEGT
jgi:hypothetical protein